VYLQWDILSNGGLVEQVAQLAKGQAPGNALSLFKAEVRHVANVPKSQFLHPEPGSMLLSVGKLLPFVVLLWPLLSGRKGVQALRFVICAECLRSMTSMK
jgi:hypothetical protein